MSDVCFVCSDGGHLEEIKAIIEHSSFDDYFFITFENEHLGNRINGKNVYKIKRFKRNVLSFLFGFFEELPILLKQRPKVIVSTGAGICIPAFIIGKLLRSRSIYIETFARIKNPSITGRFVYRFIRPDLFLVQWKHHKRVFPKALYRGAIF